MRLLTHAHKVIGIVDKTPSFIAANNLKPFISNDLQESITPVIFRTPSGTKAYGYMAELLPKVCHAYLMARDAGAVLASQAHIVKAADLLMRGLAEVGIIALVDETTGFQKDREKDALAAVRREAVMPYESLQHPLSVYDRLLEIRP